MGLDHFTYKIPYYTNIDLQNADFNAPYRILNDFSITWLMIVDCGLVNKER